MKRSKPILSVLEKHHLSLGFLGAWMKILMILWVRQHLSSVFTWDAHPIQQQNSPNWPTSNYESEVPEFGQVWDILEIQASFPINLQSCSVLSDKPSRPDDCWPRNKHRKMPKDPRSTTVRQGHGNLWAVLQDHSQPQNDLDGKRAKPWASFVVIINATVMPLISNVIKQIIQSTLFGPSGCVADFHPSFPFQPLWNRDDSPILDQVTPKIHLTCVAFQEVRPHFSGCQRAWLASRFSSWNQPSISEANSCE